MVRRVRRAGREVDEERLVRHERLLLADPRDRLVGHVLGEVVALLGRPLRLDRRRALVERRVVLVRLAADEAVEVLEAPPPAGPGVERAHRARLPDRHLVALAELRRRVAVELERLRQRRARVRPHRAVAGRRRRDLGDAAHARPCGGYGPTAAPPAWASRAPSCGSGCTSARRRRALAVGVAHGPPKALDAAEARVVDQHDQHVGRPVRWPQRARSAGTPPPGPSRRRGEPDVRGVRDGQDVTYFG